MRKIYSAVLAFSFLAFSCKKEKVEIETLSKAGEEFYYGEKVPVWAGTTGNLRDLKYSWTTTGGTFDGSRTQDLYENLWVAPAKTGEYTVTATAKDDKASSSRSTTMKVTRYFFDDFQSSFTFDGNGWAQSNADVKEEPDNDIDKAHVELLANGTSGPNIRRTLNLAPLKIPFSVKAKFGWKTFFRASQSMTMSVYFVQPATNPTIPYMRELRLQFQPTVNPATTDNFTVGFETFVPNSSTSSKFSAVGAVLPAPPPLFTVVRGRKPELAIANGAERTISMSIDAANVVHVYIDGVLWFQSNGYKDWVTYCKATYPGFPDPLAKEFRIAFPAKANTNEAGSVLTVNSVYINDDGTILK
ncbi:hypothetical protein GFS24_27460 [Chitinophaga sp. SYP-B3965]|uniref:PKD domain-containing protein n=1 Tax=Chitinophaga sp. SYP-B3965 TaxID=2663120 RepID=UPI001299BF6F|nr:PKD domain-containing protein [Chitinophaga sp. SYP-B3965]MRG48879.1 hypothetical protein [Chitinophaga sp. SYP-B3965]